MKTTLIIIKLRIYVILIVKLIILDFNINVYEVNDY